MPGPGRRGYDDAMIDDAPRRAAGLRGPTCDRSIAWTGSPARPLCSLRHRLIDLGRWLDGTFRAPGPPLALADSPVSVGLGRDA